MLLDLEWVTGSIGFVELLSASHDDLELMIEFSSHFENHRTANLSPLSKSSPK